MKLPFLYQDREEFLSDGFCGSYNSIDGNGHYLNSGGGGASLHCAPSYPPPCPIPLIVISGPPPEEEFEEHLNPEDSHPEGEEMEACFEYEERFKVDRRKLEKMIMGTLEKMDLTAMDFFEKVERETDATVIWPSRLKIGAKSKKDPHIRVGGNEFSVRAARSRIVEYLDNSSSRVTMKMDVSYTDHSHVIGRSGNTIRRVMSETSCHIHFPDSNRSNPCEKSNQVSIAGEVEGAEKARARVRELTPLIFLFDLPAMSGHPPPTDSSDPFIKTLQNQYNIQVMVRQKQRSFHTTTVMVKGCEWECARVKEATLILMDYFASKIGPPPSTMPVSMCMEISPQHHLVVLGKCNMSLKGIMQRTNTTIIFPDAGDPNIPPIRKGSVTILGAIHNVYLARQQLLGSLPLVLMFDLPEDAILDEDLIHQIQDENNVSITIKPKLRQGTKSVIIKAQERNATGIYTARARLLGLERSIGLQAVIPETYKIPPGPMESKGGATGVVMDPHYSTFSRRGHRRFPTDPVILQSGPCYSQSAPASRGCPDSSPILQWHGNPPMSMIPQEVLLASIHEEDEGLVKKEEPHHQYQHEIVSTKLDEKDIKEEPTTTLEDGMVQHYTREPPGPWIRTRLLATSENEEAIKQAVEATEAQLKEEEKHHAGIGLMADAIEKPKLSSLTNKQVTGVDENNNLIVYKEEKVTDDEEEERADCLPPRNDASIGQSELRSSDDKVSRGNTHMFKVLEVLEPPSVNVNSKLAGCELCILQGNNNNPAHEGTIRVIPTECLSRGGGGGSSLGPSGAIPKADPLILLNTSGSVFHKLTTSRHDTEEDEEMELEEDGESTTEGSITPAESTLTFFLQNEGLGKFEKIFRSHDVDIPTFMTLTEEDLKEMKIVSLGGRKRLLGLKNKLAHMID